MTDLCRVRYVAVISPEASLNILEFEAFAKNMSKFKEMFWRLHGWYPTLPTELSFYPIMLNPLSYATIP